MTNLLLKKSLQQISVFSRLVLSIRRVRTEFGVTEFAGVFKNFTEMNGFTMIFGVAFFIKKLGAY